MAVHRFAGFGLDVWALPGRSPPLLNLIQELRGRFVRWPLSPDVKKAKVPEGSTIRELTNWVEHLSLSEQRRAGQDILRFSDHLRALNVSQMVASWGFPEHWRGASVGSGSANPSGLIADNRVEDYGRLVAAQLAVLQRNGIRPDIIEPMSELGDQIFPKQYVRFLQEFRFWLDRSGGREIPVAGPGTVFTWGNRPYLDEIARAGERLDIVSTHAYDDIKTHQLASLAPLVAAIPAGSRQPVFVTEYGINGDLWYHSADAAETEPYAVRVAAQTLALYGSGANAVFYWQAQDPPWAKPPYWGLLSKEDRKRPAIGALRTILRPLQVGDNIVSSGQRETALPIVLVARPSQLVLQIANPQAERQGYDISFRNCTVGPISIARSEAWPAGREVEAQPTPQAGLRVSMPGDTVVSITTTR